MNEDIVLLKLFGGDFIIGAISHSEDVPAGSIKLINPRIVAIIPGMGGKVSVMMANVCEPFSVKRLKEAITIPESQVMFKLETDEIEKELVNGYKSNVSGIKIASAAETAALNSASSANPGEFIL